MEQLLDTIVNWLKNNDKQIIIGISGHGAAGKTTFASSLLNLLNKDKVNYINTDPYIVTREIRRHTMIDYSYQNKSHHFKMTACHPAAHHIPSLERDIQMVRDGMELYTIDTPYMKSTLISSENQVTIVEGMSVAFVNPDLFDLKIYFYTDGETELSRRLGRDVIERGSDVEYLRKSHDQRRIQYELFMHPYSEHFDVIGKASDEAIHLEKSTLQFL